MILLKMNHSEILKSFQHFYEDIIPKSHCSPNWNGKSITSAFMWANFCKQIYDKFSADPETVKKLDAELHQLTNNHIGVSYCFRNLKQANAFLYQSFLQNPYIHKDFLQDTILQNKPSELDFEEASLEVSKLDMLCLELLQSLKFITLPGSEQSFDCDIKAELLLDFLKEVLVHLSTEKQHENQLNFVFETLCGRLENLTTVLHVLISDADSEIVSQIQEFALSWILLKVIDEKNGSLAHFLWEQPPSKLQKLALKYPLFMNYYKDHLTQSATSLSLDYENFTKH